MIAFRKKRVITHKLCILVVSVTTYLSEVYLEACKKSMMTLFTKNVNDLNLR